MTMLSTSLIQDVIADTQGLPAFLTGSLVAEEAYGLENAHSDVDLFVPNEYVFFALVQQLRSSGYTIAPNFDRVWARWLRFGFKGWHTNSIRLLNPMGVEVNVVYKKYEGRQVGSLSQVLESFDFGLLGVGYETDTGTYRDMRPYLFPDLDPNGPLPLMPDKRMNWRNGFISEYNGLRQFGRYAKYHNYGHDMSAVKDDLITGYAQAYNYLRDKDDPKKQALAQVYLSVADHIRKDEIDQLHEASKKVPKMDDLDVLLKELE